MSSSRSSGSGQRGSRGNKGRQVRDGFYFVNSSYYSTSAILDTLVITLKAYSQPGSFY